MSDRIAVVGVGLRYPDADSPAQFWENVLAGRRAFRDLPNERMNAADYWSADPAAPDRHYATKAAVLRNFEFDRAAFKVSGRTYRSTDLTHWLALSVAQEAWADAALPEELAERTAVILGNSLTGEFSRANALRLRWPYVRRVVGEALTRTEWASEDIESFLGSLEGTFKAPFPAIDEDTLAGGLANTIAGRVCNHFDFQGGGYTVDGACSSSLLSVITASRSLQDRDVDVAIAGGVDLSIDPFEVVGFAKTSALARTMMKVYDADSSGFWPGEGCGMVVLMREEDAAAHGLRVYALLTGWGISSDGRGGMTRPEQSGHRAAIGQAYRRAGYSLATVSYFEGHGTGTAVGDDTEIKAISGALAEAGRVEPASLGSVKGNIGHTKAAAGIAGLIKATLALHHGVIPPATSHDKAHPALEAAKLRVPTEATTFPDGLVPRVGVSAMGFGGSNAHVALEAAPAGGAPTSLDASTRAVVAGRQDAELLPLAAADSPALLVAIDRLQTRLRPLSFAEVTDLAGELAATAAAAVAQDPHLVRAAVVVTSPGHGIQLLDQLAAAVRAGRATDFRSGVVFRPEAMGGRVGFLFPGQGVGTGTDPFLPRRFPELPATGPLPDGDPVATEVAQPRIAAESAHGLAALRHLGIDAAVAAGHSLGELTALHWSGSLTATGLVDLAARRGRVMADHATPGGAMADIAESRAVVEELIAHTRSSAVVAGVNAPGHTVVAGDADAVAAVQAEAERRGSRSTALPVSHAFHSPHVDEAAARFQGIVEDCGLARSSGRVISSLTGRPLGDVELGRHLAVQMREPVLFSQVVKALADEVDLLVEVGPGQTLSALAALTTDVPVVALRTEATSSRPFLTVAGAAYVSGAWNDLSRLHDGRVVRALPDAMTFLANPCEQAPQTFSGGSTAQQEEPTADEQVASVDGEVSVLDILRMVFAEHIELSVDQVTADTHPLDDLHLSSITVSQIATEASKRLGRGALPASTNLATVTIGELASLLESVGQSDYVTDQYAGVAAWARPFSIVQQPLTVPPAEPVLRAGRWQVWAADAACADRLAEELTAAGIGSGALVFVDGADEDRVGERSALAAAQAVVREDLETLVVVDAEVASGAAALAKSLAHEQPHRRILVLHGDEVSDAHALASVVEREVRSMPPEEFRELLLTARSKTEPVLRAWWPTEPSAVPLAAGDLLLVSGGGKGIVAESALTLASRWGVPLGLIGRADPQEDAELRDNLARLTAQGITWRYVRADVADRLQVASAVTRLEAELGPVRGIVHGAGHNTPTSIAQLSPADLDSVLAVKVDGFDHLLAAVDLDEVRLVVSFASIIGRGGLDGEAHYAAANARLTARTEAAAAAHPHLKAHALEWSVWAGTGMGTRLGVLDSLTQRGITPIPVELGTRVLVEVLEAPDAPVTLVVSSRAAALRTLQYERRQMPLLRFLESPRVDYPGIELVTDVNLSAVNDPYLLDHDLDGDLLFPAVMGLEAMAQAARAVTGVDGSWQHHGVEFLRPLALSGLAETTRLRVCALSDGNAVTVALRSEATGFAVDHFRARLTPSVGPSNDAVLPPGTGDVDARGLYGSLFFQGLRFQKVLRYTHLTATEATAVLATGSSGAWFAHHLPHDRVLPSPGTRDALMHALQCCVPDAVLLPVGIRHVEAASAFDEDTVTAHAREVHRDGVDHYYDVALHDSRGRVVERWTGLHLREVRRHTVTSWEPALLGPHLERALHSRGLAAGVAVERAASRTDARQVVIGRLLGAGTHVDHRSDGRPMVSEGHLSLAHSYDVTIGLASSGEVATDLEHVVPRAADTWSAMLGANLWALAQSAAAEVGESTTAAATRVWGALECLRKLGVQHSLLALESTGPDGWARFTAPGGLAVDTYLTGVRAADGIDLPVVASLCVAPPAAAAVA